MKGSRAFLVSDAVHLGGMQPGTYETHIGGRVTLTGDGALHIAGDPTLLAGAAAPILKGVEHLALNGLASLADAWDLASIRPATYMGLPQAKGLAAGAPADLALFDCVADSVRVRQVWKRGQAIFEAA